MDTPHNSSRQHDGISNAGHDGSSCATSDCAIDPRAFGLVKITYSVNETLELFSIGRTSLYETVKRGELRPVKFGNKTLFLATDLAVFLAKLTRLSGAQSGGSGKRARNQPDLAFVHAEPVPGRTGRSVNPRSPRGRAKARGID